MFTVKALQKNENCILVLFCSISITHAWVSLSRINYKFQKFSEIQYTLNFPTLNRTLKPQIFLHLGIILVIGLYWSTLHVSGLITDM